jgi:hypothetical protein
MESFWIVEFFSGVFADRRQKGKHAIFAQSAAPYQIVCRTGGNFSIS